LDGDVWIAVEPGDRLTLDRDQPVSLRADQSPLLVVLLQPQSIESAQTEPTSGESTAA